MPHSVQTGQLAFEKVMGMPPFEFFWKNEKAGKEFNDAMTSNSAFTSAAVLEAYDFSGISKLVDVGGGHGLLLASILKKYPHLSGVLYDVPAIVEAAAPLLNSYEVSDRCERIGGNFFESVPAGGDVYIMKHIIHDWNDAQCTTILQNCRNVMTSEGRVLVVEMVVPEGNEPSVAKLMDLQTLLYLPGCERSEADYRQLFDKAGLALTRIVPTASPFSVVEGVRK